MHLFQFYSTETSIDDGKPHTEVKFYFASTLTIHCYGIPLSDFYAVNIYLLKSFCNTKFSLAIFSHIDPELVVLTLPYISIIGAKGMHL